MTSAPTNNWLALAASADGTKLVVAPAFSYLTPGNGQSPIYVSTNSGATWTPTTIPALVWWAVASSADGTKLATYGGFIYTSTDSGATWTRNTVPNDYWGINCLAMSANGEKMFAALSDNGLIYQTQPGPILDVSSSSPNLLLSWPWYATNFTLQQSFDLGTPNWTNVATTPVVTNLQNQLMIQPTGDKRFYRLKGI